MNSTLTILRSIQMQLRRSVAFSTLPSEVVVFKDKDMVICWHPEVPFPYECSLPLPKEEEESNSVLKVGSKEIDEIFHKETNMEFVRARLAKMTYTTKHRWYPKRPQKKPKVLQKDRPYL